MIASMVCVTRFQYPYQKELLNYNFQVERVPHKCIYIFLLSNLIKYMRSQSEWYSLNLSWKHFLSELRVQMSLAQRCCFHQRLISEHAGSRFLYLHLCYFYSPKVQGGILMYISPIRCFVFLSFWGKERERWERERVETHSIYTYSVI